MINLILWKLLILNQFFNFYVLNMDISLRFPGMKFCTVGHKVLLEGTVSQFFDLGLSFYFMLKNG